MALLKNYSNANGISVENAYYKIISVTGNKAKIRISVGVYVGQEHTVRPPIDTRVYSFIPSVAEGSGNFIAQGYEYLKALDEYSAAADC